MTRLFIEGTPVMIPASWDAFTFNGITYRRFYGKFHAVNG